ncbi:cyclic nucleotide-binding domain protein (macronuclear) [Tetrahymena thermophila SB210]|uniref:Cyclic nucleotide-binding domain protein n=1 Tax=Tetrahymena thermophila (strain SB210) TaxID=312017 RepID=Q23CM4_TETTS|nr:cyclic nucleotide-binding domain protein [Tetrahymena thermophila SB210]EAR94256.2 cyclic nucleotide-binding domain protein [Tetrahymena thermophila SB210]|eukprot:XP_001014501.2 cyclic nucleotide-binding domain protein [Tetrahymena thermophila SB210]
MQQMSERRNIASISQFSDRNEIDGVKLQQLSISFLKNRNQLFDQDLLDIPMRRGESVDMEQINDTSKVQSMHQERQKRKNDLQLIQLEEFENDDNYIKRISSKNSSVTRNSKSSKQEELFKEKLEKSEMDTQKRLSVQKGKQEKLLKLQQSVRIMLIIKEFQRKIGIFSPFGGFRLIWDCFIGVIIKAKLYEFWKIQERVTYVLNYQKNMKNTIDLLRLVFIIICICHTFCLFWYGIASYETSIGKKDTWLHAQNLIEENSILIRYIYSFYFLSVTMITVGYGDITPQNPLEMVFTVITMFVTGFFWAYSLNRIGKIISNSEMQEKSYRQNMQIIHDFMRVENVDSGLRAKVSNYLQYYYKETNEVQKSQEHIIINQLSEQLKTDLMKEVKGKYLQNIPFIKQMESKSKLISIMNEVLFSPGEYIFHQEDLSDCSLFYLVKGEVQVLLENQNDKENPFLIKNIQKQNYFGEISFITGSRRSASVRAIDFCIVYKIERQKFLDILKQSQLDYETFCMMKEALILKSNYNLSKTGCFSCNCQSHLISNCPRIHFTASKNILAVKAFQSTPHLSHQKFDRKNKKFNPLQLVDLCLSSAIRFFNDQMVNQSFESNQLDEYFINQEEVDDIYSNENYFVIRNITKPLNSAKQINLQIEDGIKGSSQNAIISDNQQNQYQQYECSVVENINQNDDNSIQKYNSSNFQAYLDNDQNPALDQVNIKHKNSQFEIVKQSNNNDEIIQSAKLRENKQRQINNAKNDEQPIYIVSSHEQIQIDQSKLQISSEDRIQLESDLKLTLFPVRQNNQTITIPHNSKRQSLLKQISYKQDDKQQGKGMQNNDIKINSYDCIQSCQIPFQKMESSIKMQNSLSENVNENGQSCDGFSSLSNTSKTTKMNLFKQIKSKTLALQIKKSQKPFFIQSQNTISPRKSVQLETQKVPSSINISDEQGKLLQLIDHNKQKCASLEESIKKPVLDFQNLKFKSIKEDHPTKKRINDFTDFSIPSSFEFKAEENTHQKKTNFYDFQTELLTLNEMKAIGQQNINFKTILPTVQDNNKLIQCLNQIEWEYLSLILFDKARIFKYYYPLNNYTYIIQKIKKVFQSKKDLKSKQSLRTCLVQKTRRKQLHQLFQNTQKKNKNMH